MDFVYLWQTLDYIIFDLQDQNFSLNYRVNV